MKFMIEKAPSEVLDRLHAAGFEAFVVGGCVRDMLMGICPKDWDVTTAAPPEKVMELFEKTVPTGLRHGTVTVLAGGVPVEVTTYRVESGYSDGRRPDAVAFVGDLRQDLARRDFTVNAMAYNEPCGLIDIFGGKKDIENKQIRCVGEPEKRFEEDALRMLRAVRFAAKLGFVVDDAAAAAIKAQAPRLKNVSMQRVKNELSQALVGRYASRVSLIFAYGLDTYIHSEMHALARQDVFDRLEKVPARLPLRLAVLLEETEPEKAAAMLHEMDFDNHTARRTQQILRAFPVAGMKEVKRYISQYGMDAATDAAEILKEKYGGECDFATQLAIICETNPPVRLSQLRVNGEDLKKLGISDGKEIGRLLCEILEITWENPEFNQREQIVAYITDKIEMMKAPQGLAAEGSEP